MSEKVLIATEKPFAESARNSMVKMFEEAGLKPVVLEKYKDPKDFLSAVSDVAAVVIRSDKVTKEVLEAGKNLKLVVRAGAGYDNVDCASAKARKVIVENTPGQNSNAVAELALGLMIMIGFVGKSLWDVLAPQGLAKKVSNTKAIALVALAIIVLGFVVFTVARALSYYLESSIAADSANYLP